MLYYEGTLLSIIYPPWNLMSLRNLIVAPLTEELCFRSGLISYLLMQGTSSRDCILISPFLFALAHFHHVFDNVRYKGIGVRRALVLSLFQMSYTTIFGWLAAFLLIRTGHFMAPLTAHIFCNRMGVPNFWMMMSHPNRKMLILSLITSIITFSLLLRPLTKPQFFGFETNDNFISFVNSLRR